MNEQETSMPTSQPVGNGSNNVTPEQSNRQKVMAGIAGVVILLLIGGGVWYWQKSRPTPPTPSGYGFPYTDNQQQPFLDAQVPDLDAGTYFSPPVLENPYPQEAPKGNTNVSWKTPVKISDQKLIKLVYPDPQAPEILYFNLGTHGANKIIMAQPPAMDLGGPQAYIFEQTQTGFIFMNYMSGQDVYRGKDNPGSVIISPSVTSADSTTYYNGLHGPSILKWNGMSFKQYYPSSMLHQTVVEQANTNNSNYSYKKVATINEGELYLAQNKFTDDRHQTNEKFLFRSFDLKSPSGFNNDYFVTYDFMSDNQVPAINWNDGTKNNDGFRHDIGGCGLFGAYVVPERDISNAVKVTGKTSNGAIVYEFKSINDPIVKFYYGEMGGKYYDQNTGQETPMSIEDWFKRHGVITIKNGYGDYVLMSNTTYGSAAECGKPVVYLYPTKPTVVSVKVDANVTVSEPEYGKGWKVLAQPDGKLLNSDGKTYDSLFWEGLGRGEYPLITQGTVVPKDQVQATITDQLKQLGLNEKESQDFKDFWISKMPKDPYVRLTWFTTSQMDQLAPLYVTPRPDTIIRVFLDFQGLQSDAVSLPTQRLSSIPRRGFTVIEWGGLLRK